MDIFDRLMAAKMFAWFQPFYKQHKEKLLYLFFGGLTTVVSLVTFWLVNYVMMQNEHVANIASWLLAVLFAFVTNRTWVFKTAGKTGIFRQMTTFYGGRLFTFGVEELIILVFITWLCWNSMAVKIAAQIVVLVSNYIVSKTIVFKK